MKFSPGDIAWVQHWFDDWDGCNSGWRLATWEGSEQVVTFVRYVEGDGAPQAEVLDPRHGTFVTYDEYLVGEKEANNLRRMNR
jgi:hypothetical protein